MFECFAPIQAWCLVAATAFLLFVFQRNTSRMTLLSFTGSWRPPSLSLCLSLSLSLPPSLHWPRSWVILVGAPLLHSQPGYVETEALKGCRRKMTGCFLVKRRIPYWHTEMNASAGYMAKGESFNTVKVVSKRDEYAQTYQMWLKAPKYSLFVQNRNNYHAEFHFKRDCWAETM